MIRTALLWVICAVCMVSSSNSQEAVPAEREPVVTYGVETDLASRYLWRGLACSRDAVSQNSLWFSSHGVTGSIWSNYDFRAHDGDPSLNEFDLGLAAELAFGGLSVEPAIQTFHYPNQSDLPWTGELSLTVSATLGGFSPFITHNLDFKAYSGAYFGEIGLAYDRSLWESGDLHTQVELGFGSTKFNEAYVGPSRRALQLCQLDADLSIRLSETWFLRPHAGYSWIASRAIGEWVDDRSHVQFGLAFGGDFSWAD